MSRRASSRRAQLAATLPAPAPKRSQRWEERISQRPEALWHPLPLTELLMVVGLGAIVYGLVFAGRGGQAPDLAAGVGAMAIGVIEFTAREHVTGYRKHRAILAIIAAVIVHLGIVAFAPFRLIGVAALVTDIAVFAVAFYLADRVWRRAVARRQALGGVAAPAAGAEAPGA